jgi:hypothetical protein
MNNTDCAIPRLLPLLSRRTFVNVEVNLHVGEEELLEALRRHRHGDWGDADNNTVQNNRRNLCKGGILISCFTSSDSFAFYVLTELEHYNTWIRPNRRTS